MEDAGDKVLGDPLLLLLPPAAVLVTKGRNGGCFEEAALEVVEAVVGRYTVKVRCSLLLKRQDISKAQLNLELINSY